MQTIAEVYESIITKLEDNEPVKRIINDITYFRTIYSHGTWFNECEICDKEINDNNPGKEISYTKEIKFDSLKCIYGKWYGVHKTVDIEANPVINYHLNPDRKESYTQRYKAHVCNECFRDVEYQNILSKKDKVEVKKFEN